MSTLNKTTLLAMSKVRYRTGEGLMEQLTIIFIQLN